MNDFPILPDGSSFFTASLPLPTDHWLYAKHRNIPPMPLRLGTSHPQRQLMNEAVRKAARYAVRSATMNGADNDFDPDALVQNMIVGLLGYHTADALCHDEFDPSPAPPEWPLL
jgi:hypothetical protein